MKQEMQLDGVKRRQKIVELLETDKAVTSKVLAQAFCVSEMTIRRDFHILEEMGIVDLHYGGASLRRNRFLPPRVSDRDTSVGSGKRAIAAVACSFLKEGTTVYLDGGSTVLQMMRFLPDIHLKIITNSMPVIEAACLNPKLDVVIAPGQYNRDIEGMIDLTTYEFLRRFHVDQAFLGAYGCDLRYGVSSNIEIEAYIKTQMERNAAESFLLADHQKFQKNGSMFQNDFSDFSHILVDDLIDPEILQQLEKKNQQVIVCSG